MAAAGTVCGAPLPLLPPALPQERPRRCGARGAPPDCGRRDARLGVWKLLKAEYSLNIPPGTLPSSSLLYSRVWHGYCWTACTVPTHRKLLPLFPPLQHQEGKASPPRAFCCFSFLPQVFPSIPSFLSSLH